MEVIDLIEQIESTQIWCATRDFITASVNSNYKPVKVIPVVKPSEVFMKFSIQPRQITRITLVVAWLFSISIASFPFIISSKVGSDFSNINLYQSLLVKKLLDFKLDFLNLSETWSWKFGFDSWIKVLFEVFGHFDFFLYLQFLSLVV